MKKLSCLFLAVSAITNKIYGDIITEPGYYKLEKEYINPYLVGDMFSIQTNNVTLDLNHHVIYGGTNSIVIESGYGGIHILNGWIGGAQTGLVIKDNASNIQLESVGIVECNQAIAIEGSTGNEVYDIFLENVQIALCATSVTTTAVVMNMDTVQNVIMRDCLISDCGNQNYPVDLCDFINCNNAALLNVMVTKAAGNPLREIFLSTCSGFVFENVGLLDSISTNSDITSILLYNSSFNDFDTTRIITSSCAGNAIGIELDASFANFFHKTFVSGLFGVNAYGMYLHGSGSPTNTNKNNFEDSTVSNNYATTGTATGFLIENVNMTLIAKNRISHQFSDNVAVGILLQSNSGNSCKISENDISHIAGSSNALTYGIYDGDTTNIYWKNVAAINNITNGNLLYGLPTNSVTLVTSDLINTITLPWTNVGIYS